MVEVHHPEAVAEILRPIAERGPDRKRAEDAADYLARPVHRHLAPGESLRHREREGHGRVDVAARDLADRVDHRDDDQAEGERDEAEVGARERRLGPALEQEDGRHGAGPDEDEQAGPDDLGDRSLERGVLLHCFYLLGLARAGTCDKRPDPPAGADGEAYANTD